MVDQGIGTGVNSIENAQRAANPKLPLSDTICHSYSAYFRNFSSVLRISSLWLVVIAPMSGFAGWAQAASMASLFADMRQKTRSDNISRATVDTA